MSRERTQAELRDTCDKACEILKKTKDGDLLSPSDLKLTEYAVNGHLNEAGREVFEKLYQRVVVDGAYKIPYLHGIENLTNDHVGYVYYKGNNVEHYDLDYVYSEDAKHKLAELARRCEFLERKSEEISTANVIWGWGNYKGEYSAERLKELDALLGENAKGLFYSIVEVYCLGRTNEYFVCGKPKDLEEVRNHPVAHDLIRRKYDDEYEVKISSFVYDKNEAKELIPSDKISNKAEVEILLQSVHDYMKDENMLAVLQSYTHKTDFAEGYENTKRLDDLINRPGRGLEYSLIDLWSSNNKATKFFLYGTPPLDEIKEHFEYQMMDAAHGVRSVGMTTFVYGNEPLKPSELPPIEEIEALLFEVHYYLEKTGLSRETRWTNFSEDVVVSHSFNNQSEPEEEQEEAEDGYEP